MLIFKCEVTLNAEVIYIEKIPSGKLQIWGAAGGLTKRRTGDCTELTRVKPKII